MSLVVKYTSDISLTISESVSSSSPRLGLVGTHQILLFVMKASKHHHHLCLLEEFHICQMNTSLMIKVTVVIDDGDGSIAEKAPRLVICLSEYCGSQSPPSQCNDETTVGSLDF